MFALFGGLANGSRGGGVGSGGWGRRLKCLPGLIKFDLAEV